MFLDYEQMIYSHLEEKIEDLYVEHLGDDCPLVVDWFGKDLSTACVVFKDYEFKGVELLLGEDIGTGEIVAQFQYKFEGRIDDIRDKFLRKHKKTLEIIYEQWFPNSEIDIN